MKTLLFTAAAFVAGLAAPHIVPTVAANRQPAQTPRVFMSSGGTALRVLVDAKSLGGNEVEVGELTFPANSDSGDHRHADRDVFRTRRPARTGRQRQAGRARTWRNREHPIDRSGAAQERPERGKGPRHLGAGRRDRSRHRALEGAVGTPKYPTPEGGGRLKQWFATAPRTERDRCKTAFIEQQPFFVFDESPLLVVYTRTRTREIQVLYFTVAAAKAAAVDELLQHHSVGPGLQTRPAVRGSRFDQSVPPPGGQVSNASPLSTRFHQYGNVFLVTLH